LITLEEARAEVLAACRAPAPVQVDLAGALGLVLAEAVTSPEDVPPFSNTAMDGYAVRAADVAGAAADRPTRLKVVGTRAAGPAGPATVAPGEALRIMTGALFPDGADAVAIVENTRTEADGTVLVLAPAVAGQHIRHPGEDIRSGQELFPAGTVLGPGHLGVLASVGCQRVAAVPAPVVGVVSTGDELVEGGNPLQPGQIRDSNRRTLLSLLARDGFAPVDLGLVRDDESAIEAVIRDGAARCDALLTSGGVSMGDFDYVKSVLDRIGRMHWMQVAIRPAKPFAFGVVADTPVFGLPGNPVSSMVSYELLARPGLRRLSGRSDDDLVRPAVAGLVDDPDWRGARDGRVTYLRVTTRFGQDGRVHVASAGGQGSHQLYAMAVADALAVVPPGVSVSAGDEVDVLMLGSR
jgi:molybdopterin molybdotransferase